MSVPTKEKAPSRTLRSLADLKKAWLERQEKPNG
jgi:hypothetical protein